MSLNQYLDQQPTIKELVLYARTAKWNDLGVILELDSVNLAECNSYTKMYQLWIQEKADKVTRRSLLDALRAIKQNNVANSYEDHIKMMVSYIVMISMYTFT